MSKPSAKPKNCPYIEDSTVFSPEFEPLAGKSPELSPVEPPAQASGSAAVQLSAPVEGYLRRTAFDAPTVLEPGLPNTPIERCQRLLLAVVLQGIEDAVKHMRQIDVEYILGPTFVDHVCMIGSDPDTAFNIRLAFLGGKIKPGVNIWVDAGRAGQTQSSPFPV